jgi:hypothetical protein
MAAGQGFKTFTTGEVLTAADTNGYLMQGVLVFADAAARTAAITSPQEGQTSYLKDTDEIQVYSGSAWVTKSGSLPSQTGNSGKYLTTDGTNASWGTVSAGGAGDFTLLNAGGTALTSGTTVTVSGISNIEKLYVYISDVTNSSTNAYYGIRLNGDTGATNYYQTGLRIQPISTGGNYESINTNTNDTLYFARTNSAGGAACGTFVIQGCKSSGKKIYTEIGAGDGGANAFAYITQGYYNGSSTISSVSVFTDRGAFTAGTLYVYGSSN